MKADPAYTVVKFLGGAATVAAILECDVTRVYRWQYPAGKNEGKGGLIPSKDAYRLLQHAAAACIDLRAEDFFDAARLRAVLAHEPDAIEAAE